MSHRTPHIIPNDDEYPFDEELVQQDLLPPKRNRSFYHQTSACLRALAGTSRVQPQDGGLIPVMPKKATTAASSSKAVLSAPARPRAPSPPHSAADCNVADCLMCDQEGAAACGATSADALAMLSCNVMEMADCSPPMAEILALPSLSLAAAATTLRVHHTALAIGPPQFNVFKTSIPDALLPLLHPIVARSEDHAQRLPGGWQTNLYSLTKQDLPLAEIPGGMSMVQPLTDFVVWSIQQLYKGRSSLSSSPPMIRMDANQPHILKYDDSHTGVPLHHDRCDVTAQLLLSRTSDYTGGGTYFCDMDQVVRLERGEVMFHPGSLVHAGRDITSGSRLLLVWFVHLR